MADLDFEAPYHGSDGPIPVVRWPREQWLPAQHAFYAACVDTGFAECADHNAPGVSGVGPIPVNTLEGVRWSTSVGYLNAARERFFLLPSEQWCGIDFSEVRLQR